MKETLHEAAMRVTGKRGCAGGCTSGCYFDKWRDDNGCCLIRRIAQCGNADEQIQALHKWAEDNPPKPRWIEDFNSYRCSNCGSVYPVGHMITSRYTLTVSKPSWKHCPQCGVRMEDSK